jgi:hypothetical protein
VDALKLRLWILKTRPGNHYAAVFICSDSQNTQASEHWPGPG